LETGYYESSTPTATTNNTHTHKLTTGMETKLLVKCCTVHTIREGGGGDELSVAVDLKFDRSTGFYRSRQLNPPEMAVSQVCAMLVKYT